MELRSPDYFYQRPHINFFNSIMYSKFVKAINPFHEHRSFVPKEHIRQAVWFDEAPGSSWVDGVLDYTYNKQNKNSIGHFHWHEDRKNKPFKDKGPGGDRVPYGPSFTNPVYAPVYTPKGCARELTNYQKCSSNGGDCFNQKIGVMEVCPKWALELLKEKKRLHMRASLIDNETYRRAMEVSDYNLGRTVADVKEDKDLSYETKVRADQLIFK